MSTQLAGVFCAAVMAVALAAPGSAPKRTLSGSDVAIQMKNVDFRLADDVVLEIRALRGALKPARAGEPVTFDDVSSFDVAVDTAESAVSPESLGALMNSYVSGYEGSPIRNVSVEIEDDRIKQKGTLHKGIGVAFEIEAALSANADGDIVLNADKVKADHIPVKGLLRLFGDDLADLIKRGSGRGMKVEGDDIILMPEAMAPAPHIDGRMTRMAIEDGKIAQYMDSGLHLAALRPPLARSAYIYHRGGTLGFGKLTMRDADLEIVGDRPSSCDFFQIEYSRQLFAVYSKSALGKGLIAYMADYSASAAGRKRVTPTYSHVNHCQSDMGARMQTKEIEFTLCRG